MRPYILLLLGALLSATVLNVAADEAYSIPKDKIDPAAIYWGDPSEFRNPAHVDYTALIESTPEFKEMKKKKLSSSDPASWILMSDAADRVTSAIVRAAKDTEYDLICAEEYWKDLELDIPAADVTMQVKEQIEKKD
jgi:hypothetical protein